MYRVSHVYKHHKIYFYRLQTKFAKVMFSQVSVCSQGACLPHCMLGYTHPRADTPQADTHLPQADTPPPGRHPPGQTPPRQTPGQTPPCPVHAGIHTPPVQCMLGYGQQVGGTHPTGMHSCHTCTFITTTDRLKFYIIFSFLYSYLNQKATKLTAESILFC